jgi:6-pyruvoyl-tetrahydropterin synthase
MKNPFLTRFLAWLQPASPIKTAKHPEHASSHRPPAPPSTETPDDFWQIDEAAVLHPPDGLIYELSMDLFFNATHSVIIEGQAGPLHTHSYRLQVRCRSGALTSQNHVVVTYQVLRQRVRLVTAAYNNQVLNDLAPFRNLQTTTENLTAVIHQQLSRLLEDLPVELRQITIWESPTEAVTITCS